MLGWFSNQGLSGQRSQLLKLWWIRWKVPHFSKKGGKCNPTFEIRLGTSQFIWEPIPTEFGVPRTFDSDLKDFNTIELIGNRI